MKADRYIVVAGNPFTGYTGTTSYTGLYIAYTSDNLKEVEEEIPRLYEKSGGLLIIIDTETNEVVG